MIRLIILLIFLLIYFILSIPVFLIEWIIGKINIDIRHRSSRFIVSNAFKICMWISGVKVHVKGRENIPDEACLFVGNHNGFFDILVSYTTIGKVMGFVAKKEIRRIPLLNVWMYYVNCLFLDRKNIREGLKTILQGAEYIKNGISVFVFPEGTRSKDGKLLPFKEGSMKMAEKSNGIIIPVAMTGTAAIFEDQLPRLKPGVVTIEFGTPINTNELSKEEKKFLGTYTQHRIQEMLDKTNDAKTQ